MVSVVLKRWNQLNDSLCTSFKNCRYELRPSAGAGLWLVPLIPFAVALGAWRRATAADNDSLSFTYFSTSLVSIGLLFTTVCYLVRFLPRRGVLIREYNVIFAVPAIGTLLTLLYTQNGLISSILGGLASSYGALAGIPTLLTIAPRCFSLGEAVVVVQTVVLFLFSSLVNLSRVAFSRISLVEDVDRSYDVITVILQTGLLGVGGMICALLAFPRTRQPVPFFALLGSVTIGILAALHILLGGSPVMWIVQLIVQDEPTVNMMICWIICISIAALAIGKRASTDEKATTSQRKLFHVLAVFVFTGGLLTAPDVLYLASGVTFAVFVVLEAVRILNIPPFGEALQLGFNAFVDEKDGSVALTPLYLLAGVSVPLWLTPIDDIPLSQSQLLPLLCGILSIGIGDSAASLVGSKFGRHKWKGGNRTVEGSVACFLSQVAFIALYIFQEYLPDDALTISRAVGAAAVISIVEALTDQVDNLALPILMYLICL